MEDSKTLKIEPPVILTNINEYKLTHFKSENINRVAAIHSDL